MDFVPLENLTGKASEKQTGNSTADYAGRLPASGASVKIAPKHDFAAKLRQPSLLPRVKEYVEWHRAVRRAMALGEVLPGPPEWLGPFSINLDTTTACSYRCPHCIDLDILDSGINYVHAELVASLENLMKLGLRSVILIGGGEPTLYKKFAELVRFLKSRGMQIGIVTNGSRNDMICEIADCFSEKDWVRMSLDSGTNETFIPMHKPKNKNLTLESICSWVPRIKERNPKVQLGFSFIVIWDEAKNIHGEKIIANIHEIALAAKLARDHRFGYISYKAFLERYPTGEEVMDPAVMGDIDRTIARIREKIYEAKQYETDDFRVLESTNLKLIYNKAWQEFMRQPPVCHMQAFHGVLSPLGFYNCPAWRPVRPEAKGDGYVAERDAYASAESVRATQVAIANKLLGFNAREKCANITCLYNSANWWLERAVRGELEPEELEEMIEREDYFF